VSENKSPETAYRAGIVEDIRPWGKFRRFPHEDAGSVKIITVVPGGRLSLQYHDGRAEFWVVLDPGLEVPQRGNPHPPPRPAPPAQRRTGAGPGHGDLDRPLG
jgi:hypothetical protein